MPFASLFPSVFMPVSCRLLAFSGTLARNQHKTNGIRQRMGAPLLAHQKANTSLGGGSEAQASSRQTPLSSPTGLKKVVACVSTWNSGPKTAPRLRVALQRVQPLPLPRLPRATRRPKDTPLGQRLRPPPRLRDILRQGPLLRGKGAPRTDPALTGDERIHADRRRHQQSHHEPDYDRQRHPHAGAGARL